MVVNKELFYLSAVKFTRLVGFCQLVCFWSLELSNAFLLSLVTCDLFSSQSWLFVSICLLFPSRPVQIFWLIWTRGRRWRIRRPGVDTRNRRVNVCSLYWRKVKYSGPPFSWYCSHWLHKYSCYTPKGVFKCFLILSGFRICK